MIQKQCPQCGKSFAVKPSHVNKRTYCSKPCMSEAYKHRMGGVNNPRYSNADERTCSFCGCKYHSYVKGRKYCSLACAANAHRKPVKSPRKRVPYKPVRKQWTCLDCGSPVPPRYRRCEHCKQQALLTTYICTVCGESFKFHKYKKTCSQTCLNKHKSARQQGEQSHLWQGGKTDATRKARNSATYGNWRTAVFERDDYTCQMCNHRGGKLAAHHIKPFSTNRQLALQTWNGITLCWECHRSIKGKEREYEAQFFAHTNGCAYIVRSVEDALEVVGLQ